MRKLVLVGAERLRPQPRCSRPPSPKLPWPGVTVATVTDTPTPHPPTASPIRHGGTVLPTIPITPGGVGAGGDIATRAGAGGVGRQLSPAILPFFRGCALRRISRLGRNAAAAQRVADAGTGRMERRERWKLRIRQDLSHDCEDAH
jgi:hypothetical protein